MSYDTCITSLSRHAQASSSIPQEEEARGIFQQLLLALDYCHGMGISNRDVKLDNVLLTSSKKPAVIKLTDFGFCKRDKSIAKTLVGTAMYMGMQFFCLTDSKFAHLHANCCYCTHLSHHAPYDATGKQPGSNA